MAPRSGEQRLWHATHLGKSARDDDNRRMSEPLDTILIGGGGAELAPLVEAIQRRFVHAWPVERPQLAIARGYARLARRYAGEL